MPDVYQWTLFETVVGRRCNGIWAGTGVDPARLVRNARLLIETACVAAAARQAALNRQPAIDESFLKSAATACRLAPENAGVCHATAVEALGDPSWQVNRVYDRLGAEGTWSATARYWTLHWLGAHGQMEHSEPLEVPVVAVGIDGESEISSLVLIRHADAHGGPLVEHPENALQPLAADLVTGMDAAYSAADSGAVIWHLKAPASPRKGDSLTGAAAVGLVKLRDPEPHYPSSVAILARVLKKDGKWVLEKVGGLQDKIAGIARSGRKINRVLAVLDPQSRWPTEVDGIRVVPIQSLQEAVSRCTASTPWTMPDGQKLLRRYVTAGNPLDSDDYSLTYRGEDDTGSVQYLIKVFPLGTEDKSVTRALWDRQVRTMYRLASSRRTDASLVLMHDTGVDPAAGEGDERGAFVLVMTAPGYERLSDALALQNRQKNASFRKNSLIFANHRRQLWDALRRIAKGIEALHVQQVVHWSVTAKNVFWDGTDVDTVRLGGYEKSPRFSGFAARNESLGARNEQTVDTWPIPPERSTAPNLGLAFVDDWYGFGMLAARLFYPIENLADESPDERNRMIVAQIRRDVRSMKPKQT